MTKRASLIYLVLITLLLAIVAGYYAISFLSQKPVVSASFNGTRALTDVQTQIDFGPRTPGSQGHAQVEAWMREQLVSAGWKVEVQESTLMGHPIHNIVAKLNDSPPQIILGAHYDSRLVADQDPDPSKRAQPMPGANDGASGVAVLLELARTLPKDIPPTWLVFFDAEDNGNIKGWDWLLGSRVFANELTFTPRAVVVIDMIGDANLDIYYEQNSNKLISKEIWEAAAALGHSDVFIPQEKYSMLDDHTPFLEKGIPAVDIIDFDYPYWHTTQDTPDKVSAKSLQAVGETLWHWVVAQKK